MDESTGRCSGVLLVNCVPPQTMPPKPMTACIPGRWCVGNVDCRSRGKTFSVLEHLIIEIQVPNNLP